LVEEIFIFVSIISAFILPIYNIRPGIKKFEIPAYWFFIFQYSFILTAFICIEAF